MLELPGLDLDSSVAATLPDWAAIVEHLRGWTGPTPVGRLREARRDSRPVIQPRCGVGGHAAMIQLLRTLERTAAPGILSITIDSYTRLKRFADAARGLRDAPADLNGYPLVTHGWQRARELTEVVSAPLEVRHGSPDARELFAVSLAGGITSFEGGGISYNLPYSKDVPLPESLMAWRQVDAVCGQLAEAGVIIDRELFGTLTGVLVPPSASLAISMLEAMAAVREGVRCVSIAYPQGGEAHQDIAALRAIPELAARYLPPGAEVYPVLHQFMGVFPRGREAADALICYGALVGRQGGAIKIVNKTYHEAYGIPDAAANAAGIRLAAVARSSVLDVLRLDEARIAEEKDWIVRETAEIVDPVLDGGDLYESIAAGFRAGTLDVPFSASIHARSEIVPKRDLSGAIRYLSAGSLPLARSSLRRNEDLLGLRGRRRDERLIWEITADINYFLARDDDHRPTAAAESS